MEEKDMSSTNATPETPATPVTPQTPDPTIPVEPNQYAAAADSFIARFLAMEKEVPRFTLPPSRPVAKRLIVNANVPDAFLAILSSALITSPQLAISVGTDAIELRDVVNYALSFGPVVKRSADWTAALDHSVTDARHKAGTDALNVYALAKRLAKKPGYEWLIPVVANLQKALGRKKPHPRKQTTPAPTTPASASKPESSQQPQAAEKLP
jgi:hypothetical protein